MAETRKRLPRGKSTRRTSTNINTDIRKINNLIKKVSSTTSKAQAIIRELGESTEALDRELGEFIRVLEIEDPSGQSSGEIRKLRAKNGLSKRTSNVLNAQLGKIQNIGDNTLSVEEQ